MADKHKRSQRHRSRRAEIKSYKDYPQHKKLKRRKYGKRFAKTCIPVKQNISGRPAEGRRKKRKKAFYPHSGVKQCRAAVQTKPGIKLQQTSVILSARRLKKPPETAGKKRRCQQKAKRRYSGLQKS